MQRNTKVIWFTVAILGIITAVGIVSVSLQADSPVSYRPNDRANHHPLHPVN